MAEGASAITEVGTVVRKRIVPSTAPKKTPPIFVPSESESSYTDNNAEEDNDADDSEKIADIRRPLLLTVSINGNFFFVSDIYMLQIKHLLSFGNLNIVLIYCLIVSLNNMCSLITTLNVEL